MAFSKQLLGDFQAKLHAQNTPGSQVLEKLERVTSGKIRREYLVLFLTGYLALYLVYGASAELVCKALGVVFPIYASIRALDKGHKNKDREWLIYWMIYGGLEVLSSAHSDIRLQFQAYWFIKAALFLWLYIPETSGTQKIYGIIQALRKKQSTSPEPLVMKKPKVAEQEMDVHVLHDNEETLHAPVKPIAV